MTLRTASLSLPVLLVAACGPKPEPVPEPEPVTWNSHIRPILAAKCFRCHGPLELHNESGLRLDREESALAVRDDSGGHAIVPGDLAQSLLWTRIHAEDPDELMPPPESGLELTANEKELVGKWIEQGASFEPHWAFQPLPAAVTVPEARGSWAKGEIDRFVHASLIRRGRHPAPPADPRQWLRRVGLDLTGLPPSVEEIEAFLEALENPAEADAPSAHEAAVDRLLASPSFGEHMATAWLTSLGYADAWGFEEKPLNTQWPYRDWVARAFNGNLPYHQFVTQQLAGDLLDDPTADERIATAFLRSVPLTAGLDVRREERLANVAADRAANVGTAVLGLTLDCARCHHHPFDPLSRRDFHGLMAFMHSIDESGRVAPGGAVPAPTLALPGEEQRTLLDTARQKVRALEARLAALPAERDAAFREWLGLDEKLPVIADTAGIFTFDDKTAAIPNRALGASASGTAGGLRFTSGVHGSAVQFDGIGAVVFLDFFSVERWNPWTFAMWLRDDSRAPDPATIISRGESGSGIELQLAGGHLVARLARDWPGNAIAVRSTRPAVPKAAWTHVTWTYDGSGTADGLRIFVQGKPVETAHLANRLAKAAVPAEGIPLRLGPGPESGAVDDFQLFARALTPLEVAHLHDGTSLPTVVANGDEQLDALRTYYFSSIDPVARRLRDDLAAARRDLVEAENPILEVAVMRELPEPRPLALTPGGAPIPPSIPAPLGAPPGSPATRLDLATWLTTGDHPLTARVFVNRTWARFFGQGIVATTAEFGMAGAAPADAGLLDWLARDFVDSGWDIKRLCRKIVLSAAYRQESAPGAASPFLPRPREMSAGELRDLALNVSGLLDPTVGGPPVPDGTSHPQRHRRTLYSAWHRPGPRLSPVATGEDGDEHACIVQRSPDAAPQLLLTRHIEQHLLEAARAFAEQVLRTESAGDEDRLRHAFGSLAGRPPNAEELVKLNLALIEQRDHFNTKFEDAPQLVRPRQPDDPEEIDPQELAAWIALLESLFRHEAVIRKP